MHTGMPSRPASFVSRYKVAVRKSLAFQKRIAKLGPLYLDCNQKQSTCTRSRQNPRMGCPDCEFTIEYNHFIETLKTALDYDMPKGTRTGQRVWPPKFVLDIVYEMAFYSSQNEKTNPKWPVHITMLVGIYKDEVSKMRATESWQLNQQAQAALNKPQEDDDDGEDYD